MTDFTDFDTAGLLAHAEQLTLADPSGDDDVRWDAVRELHSRGEPAIFEQATRWSNAKSPLLRALAADVLSNLDWPKDNPYAKQSEPLLTRLLNDSENAVTVSALHAMGRLQVGSITSVSALSTHDDANIRYAVADCLSGREDALSIATLIQLSDDPDSEVRDWATFGLGSLCDIDSTAIRTALFARLEDDDEDTRCEAMVGLATRNDTRAAGAVHKELKEDSVNGLAIAAAGLLCNPQFLPRLQELLAGNPDDPDVIHAIAECQPHEG